MKKKLIPLKRKILLTLIPVMIVAFALVFFVTLMNTRKIVIDTISSDTLHNVETIDYKIQTTLSSYLGLLDTVKKSIDNSCSNEQEIKDYVYSIADAYPDMIPSGIYCGLGNGTYIDKLWTPDDDWVMKERPWYIEGIKSNEITFGEMYLDADTKQYIISLYGNIKNSNGVPIGVIACDIPLNSILDIIVNTDIADGASLFAYDGNSGLVLSKDSSEKILKNSDDEFDKEFYSMIENNKIDDLTSFKDKYLLVSKIENTSFYICYQIDDSDLKAPMKSVKNYSFFASLIGVILMCISLYLIVSHFLKPMSKLDTMIKNMKNLNLTQKVNINTRDEISIMAESLNEMSESIKETISQMVESISEIDDSANTNSSTAKKLALSSEQQVHSVENLNNIMNEMSSAIEMISEGATNMAGTVSNTARYIEEADCMIGSTMLEIDSGYSSMNNMSDTMNSITKLSDSLRTAVENVSEGISGITQMVTVINDIADQTNLLSLNASIEAARAGDAGKGFAIVAEEIRDLSENCANSVAKIRETVDHIETLVNDCLKKTDESSTAVRLGGKAVSDTEQIFTHIGSNITKIQDVIESISTAFVTFENVASNMAASTEEQTASTYIVLNTTKEIQDLSEKFNEDGKSINNQGDTLKALSSVLDEQAKKFIIEE